jgi:REP-associated tyrosine transposase
MKPFYFSNKLSIFKTKKEGNKMSQYSFNKVWLHFIWETWNKEKLFSIDTRRNISNFLYNYSRDKNIFMKINFVNADHIHALIDLPTNLSIEDCIKLLKGSSSFYINKNSLTHNKFSWGRGYGAFSVSPCNLTKTVDYIKNQKEHHRTKSFAEEYQHFIEKYGIILGENKND